MDQNTHHCPTCGRQFRSILDYPFVIVLSFERMPIPEAIDLLSAAAARKRLAQRRTELLDQRSILEDGINMTPEIVRACNTPAVSEYLSHLSTLTGQEVNPHQLLPPLKAHGYFKWAYPVADTGIYLSLTDSSPPTEDMGTAEVQMHCDGLNLGSAGGPTLQRLGAIALLRYKGLLNKAFR
jgi:hypothetical protein